ncbi:MAG: prepilin-type N-terminal cleavage/methylation domain-containing protein [Candidatus Eisenbacteria bacterium]|nr:prepilin-type N-terminal cleavage/methylation domain-containing protein [Candidatus Eisenbacteria bacterium]
MDAPALAARAQRVPRAHGASRGFTLIELVLVLMVLAVGIPPLISLGNNCLQSLHQGAYVTTATSLAQEKLENVAQDRALVSRGWSYIVAGNYPAESPVTGFPGYARATTIATDSTYSGVTYRNVSVTVTAPDNTQVTLFAWVVQ